MSIRGKDAFPSRESTCLALRDFTYEKIIELASKMRSKAKCNLAESRGFEPLEPFGSTVFKTAAIDHSASSPSGILAQGF